eukprot:6857275-Pyramimonas_sp.AAC.1
MHFAAYGDRHAVCDGADDVDAAGDSNGGDTDVADDGAGADDHADAESGPDYPNGGVHASDSGGDGGDGDGCGDE